MKKLKRKRAVPWRFCVAAVIMLFKLLAVTLSLIILRINIPYFGFAVRLAGMLFVFKIIYSPDNPEYKIPWLLIIMAAPGVGTLFYMMFYSRALPYRYRKRLRCALTASDFSQNGSEDFSRLSELDEAGAAQAQLICSLSGSRLYSNTELSYFSSGEKLFSALIDDIISARRFVFLEYYIIKEGKLLSTLSDILIKRASEGIDVRILCDDIGSLSSLPSGFFKKMESFGITAASFSKLNGAADSEFNNRNHRKIAVIDGNIAYTGSANIADEYVGLDLKLGKWKDCGIRLKGEGATELYRLFIIDFYLNCNDVKFPRPETCKSNTKISGFTVPFGDGPAPLYSCRVGKNAVLAMLACAKKSVCIVTPYLIIDYELMSALENCVARGVNIKLLIPEQPDIKLIRILTQSYILRLISFGAEVYFYTEGFLHEKLYLADGKYAIVGTMNLDNRSLNHNFECGVFIYGADCIGDIKRDVEGILLSSKRIFERNIHIPWYKRILSVFLKIFSPLL